MVKDPLMRTSFPLPTFTTIIVTRNRPDAIALSLPLHLTQSRLPEEIIVVDSSDNPGPNRSLVHELASQTSVPLTHLLSPPGMTVQRNIGLSHVSSDVVFFPDDDSLMYPGALEGMMRIYGLDDQGLIGGVCSAEAMAPPHGVLDRAAYSMRHSDRLKALIARKRFALEERFVPDPFHRVAAGLYRALPPAPEWLAAENAITVPWMTGFRMSFRTDVIRRSGFAEGLGRYALFEDTDAGFSVLKSHLLVGARNAQTYHHKAPARRANGRAMGVMQILNRAYVIVRSELWKLSPGDRLSIQRDLHRFAAYKIAQYAAAARSKYGRDRFSGAFAAARSMSELLSVPTDHIDQRYKELRAALVADED